jgi:hypothetical protein
MEMHSNNIIKQKIDSINNLPQNYEPNLESKWELLEAGLKSNKPKPFVFWFNRIGSVAAILLLFGGIGIYVIKVVKPTNLKNPATAQVQRIEKKEYGKLSLKSNSMANIQPINTNKDVIIKPKKLKKVIEKEPPLMITENKHLDTPIHSVTIAENKVIETVKKYKRFTEIDFEEPLLKKPLEIKVANIQNLKFKIGTTLPNKSLTGASADNLSFGFTKQIN